MNKFKLVGLAVLAVCAFSAVYASGAQAAAHWNVNGSALASGVSENVSETVALEEFEGLGKKATLTVSGLLRITCTGVGFVGATITGTNTDRGRFHFTECTIDTPAGEPLPNCTVNSVGSPDGTITTGTGASSPANTVKSELITVSSKIYDKFTPEQANFVEIEVHKKEGASCALSGTNKVTGTASLELPVGTNATTLQGTSSEAVAKAAGTALKYGERAAVLDAKGKLTLTSGKTWGVGL